MRLMLSKMIAPTKVRMTVIILDEKVGLKTQYQTEHVIMVVLVMEW